MLRKGLEKHEDRQTRPRVQPSCYDRTVSQLRADTSETAMELDGCIVACCGADSQRSGRAIYAVGPGAGIAGKAIACEKLMLILLGPQQLSLCVWIARKLNRTNSFVQLVLQLPCSILVKTRLHNSSKLPVINPIDFGIYSDRAVPC